MVLYSNDWDYVVYHSLAIGESEMPIIFVKPTIESHKEKFFRSVKRNEATGCLEWIAGITATGYGQFSWGHVNNGPMTTTAHRAAWWLFKGPVPDGMVLCHKCNNRLCVETEAEGHVYTGSQKQNMWDRLESGRNPSTYRWYDWKNTTDLRDKIIAELREDKTIEEVIIELNIGRTTFYRLRDFHPEIRELIEANKRWHYQRGSRKSKNAKMNPRMLRRTLDEIMAGGNMRAISHRIGITPATLRKWADRFPELATALADRYE